MITVTHFALVFLNVVFFWKVQTLSLVSEFPEALQTSSRVYHVRSGGFVNFSCFETNNTRHSDRLAALLKDAVWKGPSGDIIFPGNVELSRVVIDYLRTLTIVVARVKDTGRYSCMIATGGGKYARHEVELLIYTIPEVGLETPFVFKVNGNCMHTLHQMDALMDSILDHLCGKINPVTKKRRTCQYNVSLVCQPIRTYHTIMMESNEELMPIEVKKISTVIDKPRSHRKDEKLLRLPIVTTSSKPLPCSVRKHRNRIKHDVNYLFTAVSQSRAFPFQHVIDELLDENKSLNLNTEYSLRNLSKFEGWAEWPSAENTGRGNAFFESLTSNFKFISKAEQNPEHENFTSYIKIARMTATTKTIMENIIDSLEENMDEERRERLLSILKDVIVLDADFNSTESTFPSESSERDFKILDSSTTTSQSSDTLETTTSYLSDEVRQLLEINKIYKEDNTLQVAVMYLLKTPHPNFYPPPCSDQCMLESKIRHISWHSNVTLDLLRFIMFSTKLPDSAFLLGETASKRKVTLFCLPGFSLKENVCVPCAPGSYNKAGFHDKCDLCPSGTYQDNYGSKECISCPSGTITKVQNGSLNPKDCVTSEKTGVYWHTFISNIARFCSVIPFAVLCMIFLYVPLKFVIRYNRSAEGVWREVSRLEALHNLRRESRKLGLRPKRGRLM